MRKSLIFAAKAKGNPPNDMMDQMGWNIELTQRDIELLESFLSIMTPFKELVDKMGGEKLSTLHLVYPSLKELLAHLDESREDFTKRSKRILRRPQNGVFNAFQVCLGC